MLKIVLPLLYIVAYSILLAGFSSAKDDRAKPRSIRASSLYPTTSHAMQAAIISSLARR